MRNRSTLAALLALLSLFLAGCAWKPDVPAVPITAPWSEMKLPVSENAVVWHSDEGLFKAVHKDDKKTVMQAYIEAMKAQGWTLGKFDNSSADRYTAEMEKDGEKLSLEFYDFDNTGVIIEKVPTTSGAPVGSPTPAP